MICFIARRSIMYIQVEKTLKFPSIIDGVD